MSNDRNNPKNNKNPEGGERPKHIWTALIITLAIILIFSWVYNAVSKSQYKQTTYTDFRNAMDAGELAEVDLDPVSVIDDDSRP